MAAGPGGAGRASTADGFSDHALAAVEAVAEEPPTIAAGDSATRQAKPSKVKPVEFAAPVPAPLPSGYRGADLATSNRLPGPTAAAPPNVNSALPGPDDTVVDVRIDGNRTVATHKITGQMHTRAGRAYDVQRVQDDVRALTRMGLFVDVRPFVDRVQPGGVVVVFRVTERPLLQDVIIVGNDTYKTSVLKKVAEVKTGDATDPFAVENGRRKIEKYYQDHGNSKARVTILEGNKTGDLRVIYMVEEGPQQRIFWVNFVGNTFVSSDRLKTLIDAHAPQSYFPSGKLDRTKLNDDVSKLTAYYRSFGFFHARIGREVEFDEKQDCATVIFVINEGPRYTVGNVYFLGNHKLDNARLAAKLKPLSGQPFDQNQQTLDLQKLRDEYVSGGYVFAKVEADYRFLEEPGKLNIVYNIEEGARYHISRLNLNRLPVKPGDVVDAREIRNSGGPLKAAQLFNGVGVNPNAGLVGDITLDDRAEPKIVSSARGTAPAAKPAPPAGVPTPAAAAAMVEVKVAVLEVDRAKLRTSATELQSLGVDLDKLPATLDADKHEAIVTALLRHGLAEVVMRPQVMVLSGVKACVSVGLMEFEVLPTVLDKDRVRVECHLRKKSPTPTFEFNAPLEMRLGRTMVVAGSRLQPAKSDEQIMVLMTVKLAEGKVNQSPRAAASHETASEVYHIEPPDVIRIEVTRFPGGKSVLEGLYLVGPDGTINLRQYGVPSVAGLSGREVERQIVKAVSRKESGGEYRRRVEVASNNSKVVYVISSTKDDRVVRVPADQSTTVASALLQVEAQRPRQPKKACGLPVRGEIAATKANESDVKQIDWPAIVERGSVEANFRLLPGDRIFIGRRPPEGGVGSGGKTDFHVLEFVCAGGATLMARYARLSYSPANEEMIFEGDGQCDAELYKQGQDGAVSPFKAQKIIYFKKTGEMIVSGFHSLAIPKANEPPTKVPPPNRPQSTSLLYGFSTRMTVPRKPQTWRRGRRGAFWTSILRSTGTLAAAAKRTRSAPSASAAFAGQFPVWLPPISSPAACRAWPCPCTGRAAPWPCLP